MPGCSDNYGETNFVLPEGETVDLTCNATGVPIPVVTWYKQFKPIKDYTDGYFAGGRILPGETLRLKNVSRFCGGRYECIAENGVPPNATKVFHITVEFPPEVSLTNKRLGQSVGRETLLECRVAASPHANIYWTRERQDLPLHKTNKYVTNVYNDGEHEKTLSLNIIDITKEDFGSYTCHASNRLGQDSETMFLYENIKVTEPTVTTPPYRTHQPVRPVSPPRDSSFVNTPHYHSGNDQPGQYSESVYYNYNSKNSSPEQLVAHARMLMGMLLIWILKQIQTLQNHFFEIK
ncbi:hypothetical protein DPMN_056001 [Dreissena polymorpha]|uniref:Ig-like domain-containing protein n=1 Tax=Dreissena polymorpha TaxID=45954 RepID=A0A9D4CQX8_DREPO|nr:hypothetical protein DPMN_056001 [Dreissena polymorpha]